MSSTHTQLRLHSLSTPLVLTSVSTPFPSPTSVLIRPKAFALNPLDWKSRNFGVEVKSYPHVLGVDFAGIVEAVGSDVKHFKVGDEVMAMANERDNVRGGAFQELVCVEEYMVGKKPGSFSWEEGAAGPVCWMTAAAAVAAGLGLPLPVPSHANRSTPSTRSILILGGASLVGSFAIQQLRLAVPGETKIYTTSSPKHFAKLKGLGADECFDRSLSGEALVEQVKRVSLGGAGVDAVIDGVGAVPDMKGDFWAVLGPKGQKLYSGVVTRPEFPEFPGDVNGKMVFGRMVFDTLGDKKEELLQSYSDLIVNGRVKLGVDVKVVGKGLESIDAALSELMKKGVSGEKMVVTA